MNPCAAGMLAALLLAGIAPALAQSATTLTVVRDESRMIITNEAQASEGARSVLNQPCEEGVRSTIFYGPPGDVQMVIDEETLLRSSLAIIRRPEGSAEEEAQETIEMLDGNVAFAGRPACIEEFAAAEEPRVMLEQGRTTVNSTRFFLDRETDVALLEGPIALDRRPEGDSEGLEATAQSLSFDLGTKRSTLTGSVRVVAGERVSEAESLELDEEAGLATLTGNPASSTLGEDRIEGRILLYYLDSNDVVVVGAVKGSLEVDLD